MSNPEINWSESRNPVDFTVPKCSEPWQPIETAPLFTAVVVASGDFLDLAVAQQEPFGSGWVWRSANFADPDLLFRPAYWAPLPPFPETPQ